MDAKNNFGDKVISELVRRKNYTIFHAHCVNYWKIGNSRQPERQNFNALFVLTSRKFAMSLKEDIEQFAIVNNVGEDWLDSVYNNKLTDRDGMLMFSVNRDNNAPGFVFSTQHIVGRSEFLKDVKIDPEEAVDYRKRRNLLAAINHYVKYNCVNQEIRFDIITVVGTQDDAAPEIDHLKDVPLY